jgi:uncharacterized protein (DUF488 family)
MVGVASLVPLVPGGRTYYNTAMLIYTIGYGNRAIGDFLELLRRYGVECLVDTRSLPYSRFRPDFRKKALQEHLEKAGLQYLYLGDALGGKRIDPDCYVNGELDLQRLYSKPSFQAAIEQVAETARQGLQLVLMCAELRPDQCHRSWMLTTPLEALGFEVFHIDEHGELKTQQDVRGWIGDA